MTTICLMAGQHTPGSPWASECPLRMAAARSARSKRASQTRQSAVADP
jgi:hypothetical protein